jgi:hypothetical protein
MKKQILNFGKALSKAEQKMISGGDPIVPIYWDDFCAQQGEVGNIEGCPCTSDSNCINMARPSESGGYTIGPGTCVNGGCTIS